MQNTTNITFVVSASTCSDSSWTDREYAGWHFLLVCHINQRCWLLQISKWQRVQTRLRHEDINLLL